MAYMASLRNFRPLCNCHIVLPVPPTMFHYKGANSSSFLYPQHDVHHIRRYHDVHQDGDLPDQRTCQPCQYSPRGPSRSPDNSVVLQSVFRLSLQPPATSKGAPSSNEEEDEHHCRVLHAPCLHAVQLGHLQRSFQGWFNWVVITGAYP